MDHPLDVQVTLLPDRTLQGRKEAFSRPLHEVLDTIRDGRYMSMSTNTAAALEAGRVWWEARDTDNERSAKEKLDKLKGELPAATFSSLYNGPATKGTPRTLTGVVCLDVDKLSAEELNTHREALKGSPFVLALFTSPSGHGLKVLVRAALPHTDTPEEERRAFYATYAAAARALNLEEDPAAKDPERLCYLPHDPKVYVNAFAQELPVVVLAPPPPPAPPPQPYQLEELDEYEVIRVVDEYKDRTHPLEVGLRNTNTFPRLAAYAENGVPRALAEHHLRGLFAGDEEHLFDIPRQVANAYGMVRFGGNPWARRIIRKRSRTYTSSSRTMTTPQEHNTSALRTWTLDQLQEAARTVPPSKSTGWRKLDAAVKLRPGGVCLVGAMPGGGKSVFLINLLLRMTEAHPEEVFYFFSAEMTAREVFLRMGQALTYQGPLRRYRAVPRGAGVYLDHELYLHKYQGTHREGMGELLAHDGELLAELYRRLPDGETFAKRLEFLHAPEPLRFFAQGQTKLEELVTSGRVRIVDAPAQVIHTEELDRVLQEARANGENLGGVFVDYATRVESAQEDRGEDYRVRVIAACRELTRIAKDQEVPVVLAAQITRTAHGEKKAGSIRVDAPSSHWEALGCPHIPGGDVFAEASNWFKDADVALLLGNPTQGEGGSDLDLLEPYREHGEVPLWVKVAKNRGGESNQLLELGYVAHAQAIHEEFQGPPSVNLYPKSGTAQNAQPKKTTR